MFDETRREGRPLAELALALAMARGKRADAAYFGERFASPRVSTVLRAVAGTIVPASPGWGSELADAQILQDSFFASLRYADAFDRMLADMRQLPQRTRLLASTSVQSSAPGEGAVKVIGQLALAGGMLAPLKSQTTLVISQEIAHSPRAVDFTNAELQAGVGSSTDSAFLAAISAGAPSVAASGVDAEAFRHDLNLALALIGLGAGSRPYVIVPPAIARGLALMGGAGGAAEFPDMGIGGGSVAGVPVVVADAAADDSASPPVSNVVVADASGLAADSGELLLSAAAHANVALDGGAEATLSLWQNNLLGLRAERHFAASVARPGAVATITGAAYGLDGETSP